MNKTAARNTMKRANIVQATLTRMRKTDTQGYGYINGVPTPCQALVNEMERLLIEARRQSGVAF